MTKAILLSGALVGSMFYVVACSPVKFDVNNSPDQGFAYSCTRNSNGGCDFDYDVDVLGGKVDILFVDDNSASMSFEQKALANRFNGFIQMLDAKSVDYRIAITTTDIHTSGDNNEARAINQSGALQNGNLISFGGGINYLTPSVSDRVGRFNSAIVRPETLQCEQFIANYISTNGVSGTSSTTYTDQYKTNCPSGDERGVYAANLVLQNNPASFMRSDAHLVIIFVSDEDERSGLYCGGANNPGCSAQGYELDTQDQPGTLFNSMKAISKEKITEIHSVVVTESNCLNSQNSQTLGNPPVAATTGFVRGSMGNLYTSISQNGWGVSVSICMDTYTTSLQTVANQITSKIGPVLSCANPSNLSLVPMPADPNFAYTRDGNSITYTTAPAAGSKLHIHYTCPYSF